MEKQEKEPVNAKRWMWIVWPAFLMAAVLEMLVFAFVDPSGMHWQGLQPRAQQAEFKAQRRKIIVARAGQSLFDQCRLRDEQRKLTTIQGAA